MPNSSSRSSLPSPRDFLTSIFNSLLLGAPMAEPGLQTNSNSNPLKDLSATHRFLLVTLHVLFPSLFLSALDLLDRGLVTRVVQVTPSATSEEVWPSQAHIHIPIVDQTERDIPEYIDESMHNAQRRKENSNTFYLVRSAQSTHCRSSTSSSKYGAAQGTSYIVRLKAWNCSCAAFAFSAFPATTSAPFSSCLENTAACRAGCTREVQGETGLGWEFGGLSYDGKVGDGDGSGVPCCKHLIACLLAERWEGVLRSYVKQTRVGKEEMAGLGADGSAG